MIRSIQSILVLACVAGLVASVGCQAVGVHREAHGAGDWHTQSGDGGAQVEKIPLTGVGGYFKARAYDFADMWGLSFLFGLGVDVNARATQFIQVGGGIYDARRLGFIGRFCGWWREQRTEGGVTVAYGQRLTRMDKEGPIQKYFPNDFYPRPETMHLPSMDRTADEIGATAMGVFFGVDVFFRPVEFFDFLFGWFAPLNRAICDFKDDDYDLVLKSGEPGR